MREREQGQSTDWFVASGSIVRRVWGDADLVLLVFAGAAAEFALNRAVDWLFVTGRLPRDPLARLLSTAAYAQRIALGDRAEAARALAAIRAAHAAVERRRGERIPAWAHRDVLYLLVDYSERAFAALHRPLTAAEQRELYDVFRRVGAGLGIGQLPRGYEEWRADRERHMARDLAVSDHTAALYAAYRRHLGPSRFALLRQVQGALAPDRVRDLLRLPGRPWIGHLLPVYPALTRAGLRPLIRRVLVPAAHRDAVRSLDRPDPRRAPAA
ncbi:MAG TPA: oxygenase MpaB family protein [Gemmatimonadaceae bacterium]|nr:oxygenase MpaB family protein [Gemmatimonadaceae bacterium]